MGSGQMALLCDSNPMCYGSSAALLSILDHLQAEKTALVHGVTAEILGADPSVDATIETDLKDPATVARDVDLGRYDAVLVVSNQSNVTLYAGHGLPVFFVDILYFFGHCKDGPVWTLAEQSFVQAFPGVGARLEQGGTPGAPVVVGPLIRTSESISGSAQGGTLVHLGGGRSRWVVPGVNSHYAELVVSWLDSLRDVLPAPITLAAGLDAARVARSVAGQKIEVRTFPQFEFLARLKACDLYLTTPGLGAVFEGGLFGADMLMLPPQNATQVVQLASYESEGLVASGLNLMHLDRDFPESVTDMSEEALTHAVLESLGRLHADRRGDGEVVSHIRAMLADVSGRREAIRSFMSRLGEPGGPVVAHAIEAFWRRACQ